VIQFVIVALVIFWVVKVLSRLHVREEEQPAAVAAPTRTEELLEQIRDELAAKGRTAPPSGPVA
jgi:large conductance mechanosensitive channel